MSKHNQMIGRRGEKQFSLLCSEADVTCNQSIEDDFGWDMTIEFPPKPQPLIALDMQRGPVAALVQVKATEGATRSVQVSLANALRYAGSPLPTFIVLVALEGGSSRYFVKHVWTPLIGAWLQIARLADAEGRIDTHLQKITVVFEEAEEQTEGLLIWIEQQIAKITSPYAAEKNRIFETVGFGQARGTAKISLRFDNEHDFLDLQLGLKPNVHATHFVYHSERFGISPGQPEIDLHDVRIELTPEGQPVLLRATFPSGVSIPVSATLYKAENGDTLAWRIVTQCLDIVYGPNGRVRAKANLNAAVEASIEELALFSNLQATAPNAKVFIEVEVDGQLLDLGFIEMQGGGRHSGWPWLSISINVVRQIAAAASKLMPFAPLSAYNEAAWELEIVCALASDRFMRIDFAPERQIPQKFVAMLAYCWAEIGDIVVATVARRVVVSDQHAKGRRQVGFGAARILDGFVVKLSDWSPAIIERSYARQLEIMAGEGDILALGDLRAVATQGPGDQPLKSDLPKGRVVRRAN